MSLKLESSKTWTYLPQSIRWKQILVKKLAQGNKPKWRPAIIHTQSPLKYVLVTKRVTKKIGQFKETRGGGTFDRKIVKRVSQQNEAKQIKNKCC